jgi:MFS transporter, PPP family, 3-phenylpropionic acid transporter
MLREKLFYLAYFSSQVAVGPFLPVFYYTRGLSSRQIGLLAAARPWVSAPASFLWSAVADHAQAHKTVLLLTFVLATAMRSALFFANNYALLLFIVTFGQFLAAPATVIADASTVAKCGQVQHTPCACSS